MASSYSVRAQAHRFFLCAALLLTLALGACVSGGGYNRASSPWGSQTTASAPQTAAAPTNTTLAQTTAQPTSNAQWPEYQPPAQQPAAPTAASNLPPVKVAILLPLSGPHKELGQAMLNAAQIALFDIGYSNFQLVPHDAGSSAQSGAQAAQAAINDGAGLILGPVFADSVRAAKAVAARNNINIVAFSTDWTLADNRTFLMGFLPFGQVERIVGYAAAQGLGKMATLAPIDAYGKAAMQAYQNAAQRSGIQTVSQKTFAPGSASLDGDIKAFAQFDQRVVGQAPGGQPQISPPPFDSVFLPAGGDTARSVSNLMNQYGLPGARVKRLGTGLWDDPVMAQYQELEGAWFAAPSPNLRRDFERRYRELHGAAPPRLSTLAYDATALAAVLAQSGLQTSGRPAFDSASITNANGFAGIDGIFRFRANGMVERGLAILEFRRGQMVVIDEAPQSFQGL